MANRKNTPTELIYGVHPIIELLKAKSRKLYTLYTTKPVPEAFPEIELLLSKGTQLQYVDREILTKMVSTTDHQGFVATVQTFPFRKKPFNKEKEPVLILLDNMHDPRNVGAIMRTAVCTGINGIIVPVKNSAPINNTVYKAAAGLCERIPVMQVSSSMAALLELKKEGYEIYLTTIEGKKIQEITFKKPLCLVIGNEGQGISKNLYKEGIHVSLPQSAQDISYNASVAAGIFMFYVMNLNK